MRRIGPRRGARRAPDGYTLLLGSAATLAIGPALFKHIGYDPITNFAPVALVASVPYVMVTGPKSKFRTVKDIIADAKVNPNKLNIGVPNGAPPHLIAAWFKDMTATDIVVVPYKGAAAVVWTPPSNAGLKSPDMQVRLKALAAETKPGTPHDFAAFIAAERPKWVAMARLSNLKAE